MLVFKRALSLALSAMLACPASAFARNEKSNKQHGFRATPARSERKVSKAANTRQPAAAIPKQVTPGLALASVMPKTMGKRRDLEVIEIKGKGNRLKSRTISRPGYKETVVDNDDDGKADVFEVTQGAVTVKSYRPYRGYFTHMDMIEKRVKGEIKTSLVMSTRTRRYEIVSIRFLPYKAQLNSTTTGSVRAGDMCSADAAKLAGFEEILNQIKTAVGGEKSSALNCKLQTYQDLFFDKSCNSGDFEKSKTDMIRGLSKIMASREANTSSRPQYLQCLEENGYGYHSAKIQDLLASKLSNARTKMSSVANWTDADFLNKSCEAIEKVEIQKESGGTTKKKFTDLVFEDSKEPKLFSCQKDSGCWGKHYPSSNTIALCAASGPISNGYGIAAEDAYGSVMFHELLHTSGMNGNDEPLIEAMQNCCAPNKYSAGATDNACKVIKKRSTDDRFMAVLSQSALYVEFRRDLESKLGTDKADEYLRALAIRFKDSSTGVEALQRYDQCSKRVGDDEFGSTGCRNTLLYEVGKFTRAFTISEMSKVWAVTAPNVKVSEIVQIVDRTFETDKGEIVVGGSPRIAQQIRSPIIVDMGADELIPIDPKINLELIDIVASLPKLSEVDPAEQDTNLNRRQDRTEPAQPSQPTGTPATGSTNKAAEARPQGGGTTGNTPARTTGGASTTGASASTTPPTTGGASGRTQPGVPDDGGGIGYVDPSAQPNPANGNGNAPANPASGNGTTPLNPSTGNPTSVASGGGETGGTNSPSRSAGNTNLVGGISATGNTYVGTSPRSAGSSAAPILPTSSKALEMPAATLGSMPQEFASAQLTTGAIKVASGLASAASKLVLSTPEANAAQAIARSAPVASSNYATWASNSGPTTGRTIAAVRGGGSASSGTAGSNARQASASSKTPAGAKAAAGSGKGSSAGTESDEPTGSVAQSDDENSSDKETKEAAAKAVAADEKAPQAAGAAVAQRNLAAASVGGSAPQAATAWKAGTFRTRYDAQRFIANEPASRIERLATGPSSAFERDLADKQIGIQLNGRVAGKSMPTHKIVRGRVVPIEVRN